MSMRPTTRTALSVVAGLAALSALTACGGSTTADAPPAAASPAASAAATDTTQQGQPDMTAFRDCMAQNGVTLPDLGTPAGGAPPSGQPTSMPTSMPTGAPPSGAANGPGGGMPLPDGVDQQTFDAAQAACADLAPAMGGPGGPGGTGAPDIDASALAAFTSCLADNGVAVADGADPLKDLDRKDATVQAALDTCGPLLPAPAPAN